ncbi:MAG: IS1380 family transposase [Actinomycetota bacterium]|nr:IS1380 family transposase [Actinomycetota bacterium]
MRDGRSVTVEVSADGAGLVSHAGSALVAQIADKVGLTSSLSAGLAQIKQRRRGHDPGRVIRDLAVMLVDGGECVSDLGAVREQDALFGSVASDSTAFRMVDRIASTPGLLDAVRAAHARARARFWELHGAPERLTLDVDATLITAHSEKEHAAGNYKGGYGFHPLQVYLDETHEALGGLLRPGNAGSNTAEDHKTVIDRALAQVPAEYVEGLEILIRADSAGATHGLVDYCREGDMRFSVGYELTVPVRSAILEIPDNTWVVALDQDGSERENGEVAEITDRLDLSAWGEGCRLIVRRERPHPGAQLSFTDHDGYRFQAILTDQTDTDIAVIECRHRQHAHVEDRIRDDKDTGLQKFPFKAFALNEVWLEIVMLAHDLLVWTQALVLDGDLAKAEPKRVRYRLLHVAGRLAFSGRRCKLHLQNTWPWAAELLAAFQKLKTLTAASG